MFKNRWNRKKINMRRPRGWSAFSFSSFADRRFSKLSGTFKRWVYKNLKKIFISGDGLNFSFLFFFAFRSRLKSWRLKKFWRLKEILFKKFSTWFCRIKKRKEKNAILNKILNFWIKNFLFVYKALKFR